MNLSDRTSSNLNDPRSRSWLGTGIAETITADLGRHQALRVTARQRIGEVLRVAGDEQDLAGRLGVQWLVTGRYQRAGMQVHYAAHEIA